MGMKAKRSIIIAVIILLAAQAAIHAQYQECYVYNIQGIFMGTIATPKPFSDGQIMALGNKEIKSNAGQMRKLPYGLYYVTSQKREHDVPTPSAIEDFGFVNIGDEVLRPDSFYFSAIACADINGDSLIDILIEAFDGWGAHHRRSLPRVLIQQADNTFLNETDQWIHSSGSRSLDLELVDVENDGDIDLFLGGIYDPDENYYSAQLLININNQYFEDESPDRLPEMLNASDVVYFATFANIDDNDSPDLVLNMFTADWNTEHPFYTDIWLNDGSGFFRRDNEGRLPPIGDYCYYSITAGDINGDGFQDLILANIDYILYDEYGSPQDTLSGENLIYLNEGNGFFADEGTERLPGGGYHDTREFQVSDFDNDGDQDLLELGLAQNEQEELVRLLINDGSGYFQAASSAFPPGLHGWYDKSIVEDFNNDSYIDIFLVKSNFGGPDYDQLFINNGDGSFQDRSDLLPDLLDFSLACDAFDYQLDGDKDIIIANQYEPWQYPPGCNVLNKNTLYDVNGIHDDSANLPEQARLLTNYPNPFNNSTRISFYIGNPGPVELSIYNLTGELAESARILGTQAGYFVYLWQADSQSSGVYFCKIKTARGESSHKMILLK